MQQERQQIMIAILLKIKNCNLVLIPRWVKRSLIMQLFERVLRFIFCEKKSENPS